MDKTIKRLIWLYVILLIFEGSLRKWLLPSLANPLLIIRDPVALAIYVAAFFTGRFPFNGFVIFSGLFALVTIGASFVAGQTNVLVMLYGVRTDFFHLPLIWIFATVMKRKDIDRLANFLLLIAIPTALLMVAQYKASPLAFINRGIGADEGGQLSGAEGRIRPPGFFSFITGPQLYLPLVAALFLHQVSQHRKLWWPLLVGCGLAILISLPVSISRTVVLGAGIVVIMFIITLPLTGSASFGGILRAGLGLGVLTIGASFLPIFQQGVATFMVRWQTAAASSDGDAWGSIFARIFGLISVPLGNAMRAPFFGFGIGVGSNVGARLLQGQMGFLLAEDEWSKVYLELGPALGGLFIGFRIFIAGYLGWRAFRVLLERNDNLPILLFSACAVAIAQMQWAPPTILGFAVVGGGLTLAAIEHPMDEEDEEEEDDEDSDESTDDEEESEDDESEPQPHRRNVHPSGAGHD
jgi:hypothetical protein